MLNRLVLGGLAALVALPAYATPFVSVSADVGRNGQWTISALNDDQGRLAACGMTATEGDVTLSFMQFKSIRQRSSLALLHVPNPPATATVGITDSNSGELLMTLPAQQTRFLNEQGNLRPPEEQSLGARLEVGALLRLMVATLSDRSRTMHMVTVTVGSRGFPLDILGAGDAIYNLDTCVRDAPPP